MKPRAIDDAGEALIKSFESLRLTSYICPAGKLTIGWGHTGPDVHSGLTITPEQAEGLFKADTDKFGAGVASAMDDATDNQFAACVSLAFNIGLRNFLGSTVLREHNAGNFGAAANGFRLWNKGHVDGQLVVLSGLTRRREAEANLYRKAP